MVKALLNSINNIPNTTAQLNSAASDNVSKTDFEKLFDKQQSLASNDKRPEDNTKDDDEESSEKAVSPNDTFAGSVAYDIRQLIAFLKSAGDDTSSNTEETEVEDIDGTETLDADEITKKLLNLEEEDDDKKKDDGETEVKSEPEVETQTDDLTNNNIDSFLEDFEDVALFAANIKNGKKIKAAGGIATIDDAKDFLSLGASRLGTSRIVKAVKNMEEK